MAVYDLAHRLARKIKESEEYTDYLKIREKVMGDKNTKGMLLDFKREQFKIQAKQISGQEITEEEKEKFNNLKQIIDLNINVKKYLEAEYRIGVLLDDLQKILFGDLEIGIPQEEEKHPEK